MKVDVTALAEKMNRAGVPGDYGRDMSLVLSRTWKEVAKGKPITQARIDEIIAELGVSPDEAEAFLRKMAERDEDDNIIGILGLSQAQKWPHNLEVNGVALKTWCSWDQLFLAQVLNQTVIGKSTSPLSKKTVNITISPKGVVTCEPEGTVCSIVTLDPDKYDRRKLDELWSGLWCKIFYFASREEAETWAKDKEAILILSLDEAFELGTRAFSKLIGL